MNPIASNGRFQKFDDEIGEGTFKRVFKGMDTEEGREIAWGEISLSKLRKDGVDELMKELKVIKQIIDPHIVQLYDFWQAERGRKQILVMAMELMTGGTLRDKLECYTCKPAVIRNWGRQILQGLHALHTFQPRIIHRDLKCDNIFIDGSNGVVKIGDLGSIIFLNKSYITYDSSKGAASFMAPERIRGERFSVKVDVYSFGMCLLEMTTGESPYEECKTPHEITLKASQGKPPKTFERMDDTVLKSIIHNCIAEKENRCSVQDLLQHEFFSEGKFTVRVLKREETVVNFVMQEPVGEFSFDLAHDTPEDAVKRLVKSGKLAEEDSVDAIYALTEVVEVMKLLCGIHVEEREMTDSSNGSLSGEPTKPRIETDSGFTIVSSTNGNSSQPLIQINQVHNYISETQQEPSSPIIGDQSISARLRNVLTFEKNKLEDTKLATQDQDEALSDEYICWRKNQAKLISVAESSCTHLASKFYALDYIHHPLYNEIVSPNPGPSEYERTALLFGFIQRKLTLPETVEETWQGLIKTLESDWPKQTDKLIELAAKSEGSKAEALRICQDELKCLTQGSLVSLANHAFSNGALNDDEKAQVTDAGSQSKATLTVKMFDAIGGQIKENPEVFQEVVEILKSIGGGLKRITEKYLVVDTTPSVN